jgi:hypothetical protein
LKRIPAGLAAANFESINVKDAQKNEAEAIAARRARIRRKLFKEFD